MFLDLDAAVKNYASKRGQNATNKKDTSIQNQTRKRTRKHQGIIGFNCLKTLL